MSSTPNVGSSSPRSGGAWDRQQAVPAKRRPDPGTGLNRSIIGRAAVEVGFDRLTTTRVAEHLGVRHQSLYTHVADRTDIGRAALECVVIDQGWPEPIDDWAAYLAAVWFHTLEGFVRHPGMQSELLRVGRVDEFDLLAERAVGHLIRCGFTPDDAATALSLVLFLVNEHARQVDDRTTLKVEWAAGELEAVEPHRPQGVPVLFRRQLDIVLAGVASLHPDA